VWSPDGRSIAYLGNREPVESTLFIRAADGTGPETAVFTSADTPPPRVMSWLPDGDHLLIISRVDPEASGRSDQAINGELHLLPLKGDRKAIRLTTFSSNVTLSSSALSRDGRWLAYSSDESGRLEVYVREFKGLAGLGARWKVSSDGGLMPRWRADGRELFYLHQQGTIMAVPVGAGSPVALFKGASTNRNLLTYDVSPDGKRFLLVTSDVNAARTPLVLLTNWFRQN
jgi:Tol biopolymer transport system component